MSAGTPATKKRARVNFTTPLGRRPPSRSLSAGGKLMAQFKSPSQQHNQGTPEPMRDAKSWHTHLQDLKVKEEDLDKKIEELTKKGYEVGELQTHIQKLHDYNELKDMGQMLIGQLAVQVGSTTRELYADFELDLED